MMLILSWTAVLALFWPFPSVLLGGIAPHSPTKSKKRNLAQGIPGPTELKNIALSLELLAAILDSGASLDAGMIQLASVGEGVVAQGLAAVSSSLRSGSSWEQAWHAWWRSAPPDLEARALKQLESRLTFAAQTGTASSALLRAEALSTRRESQRELQRRTAALGVKLVLPMGLTALPAFFCLGVVPLILALFPKVS